MAHGDALMSSPSDGFGHADFSTVALQWVPLSATLNELNRSMGAHDLYPFVLTPVVLDKLTFVHERVSAPRSGPAPSGAARRAGA